MRIPALFALNTSIAQVGGFLMEKIENIQKEPFVFILCLIHIYSSV